jgi:site-specific recombinase XerD
MRKKTNEVVTLLGEFITEYLPNVKGISENSVKTYQDAFRILFSYLDEKKGIPAEKVTFDDLSENTMLDFLSYLEYERGCSVKTRNHRRASILMFAKFAAKKSFSNALAFHSGASQVPKKREPKQLGFKGKHFSIEEIAILLKMPDTSKEIGRRDVTLLSTLYATGARAQELCDITLNDITIGSPTEIRLTGKGSKTRTVTIPDTCTNVLKEYLRYKSFDLTAETAKKRHLFSSQTNEHMSIACVEGIVKKYVTMAREQYPHLFRQDGYSPHSFRHSIAVHMLEAGDSLVSIKAFLGHSTILSTAVYAQVSPELANRYLDERGKPIQDSTATHRPQALPLIMPFLYR